MGDLDSSESPIAALTSPTKDKLALMLNGQKILTSDEGLPRDWRGLAQRLDCDMERQQQLGRAASPAAALLEHCRALPVGQLWTALAAIGRLDVQDDTQEIVAADVARYQERLSGSVRTSSALPLGSAGDDEELLCVGDAECLRNGQPLPTFDAFLLYDDGDAEFAAEIVRRMEDRGIKLCDKERHLLPGVTFEHQGIIRLMETRCHRVLAVLSPRFLESAVNKFLAMFAQALGLDKRGRMLLPCVYQKCTLPSYLMYCSRLDFTRGIGLMDPWEKMYDTLKVAMATRVRSISSSVSESRPAPAAAAQSKARCNSTSGALAVPRTPVPAACEPPEKPAAAEAQPRSASRGFLRRLLPTRGRSRGSESGTEGAPTTPESEPTAETDQQRRGQLGKLFNHGKDKHKNGKHKAKAEKKKKEALLAV
ncbi:myeloid differentiation primary response protein MyD88-like isoform X1 [Amphibalanus amphitrite]|uniref:myeloid differentiation primary response protein MyD88-like isoform X1 n=1 Tax=Amphibalanus amphitrite TaxID=1232801 RepID=UPI001C90F8A4|nr:myeloid differentiation primary response protein MyD88-like isoform X1 [Amphibalanus amphitrite]